MLAHDELLLRRVPFPKCGFVGIYFWGLSNNVLVGKMYSGVQTSVTARRKMLLLGGCSFEFSVVLHLCIIVASDVSHKIPYRRNKNRNK